MRERALAAAAAWVWVPPDAEDVETSEYRLVIHPRRPAEVWWSRKSRPVEALVEEVQERVRAAGRQALSWWITPRTEPPDTAARLLALGFSRGEELDVLACDLAADGERLLERLAVPADVEIRPADDPESLAAGGRVGAEVFGEPEPTAALLAHSADEAAEGLRTGRWSSRQYVGLVDGRLVGHAGCTFADGVLRLWGGAVLPGARGRGVYRALVAARCRLGLEQGSTLALVKARPGTSGAILARAGFARVGTEVAYDRVVAAG